MLVFIIGMLIIGFIAGGIARLFVPARRSLGCLGTSLLGVAGSLLGGFLGWLLLGTDLEDGAVQFSGIIGSIIGSMLLLLLIRRR